MTALRKLMSGAAGVSARMGKIGPLVASNTRKTGLNEVPKWREYVKKAYETTGAVTFPLSMYSLYNEYVMPDLKAEHISDLQHSKEYLLHTQSETVHYIKFLEARLHNLEEEMKEVRQAKATVQNLENITDLQDLKEYLLQKQVESEDYIKLLEARVQNLEDEMKEVKQAEARVQNMEEDMKEMKQDLLIKKKPRRGSPKKKKD